MKITIQKGIRKNRNGVIFGSPLIIAVVLLNTMCNYNKNKLYKSFFNYI